MIVDSPLHLKKNFGNNDMYGTLFGFGMSDFLAFSGVLLLPALAFATVFLIGGRITGGSIGGFEITVDDDEDDEHHRRKVSVEPKDIRESTQEDENGLKLPSWLLGVFACALLGLLFASFSAGMALRFIVVSPDIGLFWENYGEKHELSDDLQNLDAKSLSVSLELKDFELLSGVHVTLNNKVIFGTHKNCMDIGTCGVCVKRGLCAASASVDATPQLIRSGANTLILQVFHSGLNGCRLDGALDFSDANGATFSIPLIHSDEPLPGTLAENQSYATCARHIVHFDLGANI